MVSQPSGAQLWAYRRRQPIRALCLAVLAGQVVLAVIMFVTGQPGRGVLDLLCCGGWVSLLIGSYAIAKTVERRTDES